MMDELVKNPSLWLATIICSTVIVCLLIVADAYNNIQCDHATASFYSPPVQGEK